MRFDIDGWLTLGALISLVLCGVAIGNLTTRSHAEQNLINHCVLRMLMISVK